MGGVTVNIPDETGEAGARDRFIPTRQTLLSRLKDWNDRDSWKVFFDTYWKLIYSTALRAGLSDAEAQDVVQETVISVSKSMPLFKYDPSRGSFKGWLRQLTRWRIKDQLRKRPKAEDFVPEEVLEREVALDSGATGSDRAWEEAWTKNLLDAAIERVKKRVDPKQFQIFDSYVLQGWPVRKVAEMAQVSVAYVYLVKHRIAGRIKSEVRYLEESVM